MLRPSPQPGREKWEALIRQSGIGGILGLKILTWGTHLQ
jgi:hypothetical protein